MSELSRRTFIGIAAAGLLTAAATPAVANDTQKASYGFGKRYIDAGIEATNYAKENSAIGVILVHGPDSKQGPSAEQIAKAFEGAIGRRGVDARSYLILDTNTPEDHMSITFTNGHTSQGPMSPIKARNQIDEIVGEHKRFSDLLAKPL